MKKQITYLVLLLTVFAGKLAAQHSAHYSQYMFNALLFNPAYSGAHEALNLTALYRNQWLGIDGAPKAISFTAHSPLKNKKVNLGLSLENENVGLFNHTQAKMMYAYRFPLGPGRLSFGLQAGLDASSFNRNRLRVRDADDPSFAEPATSTREIIAGSGIYYMTPSFYIGIASPDMVSNGINKHRTLQLHAGTLLNVSEEIKIKPSALVRQLPGSPLFINVTATSYYKEAFGIGLGFTPRNSWLAFVDVKLNEQMNFGYAYERSTGSLAAYNGGSHEVMVRYLFRYRITAINPRYF